MVAPMSIFLFVLLVGLTLAHREGHQEKELFVSDDLQIGQDGNHFEESLQTVHLDNATAADECKPWCSRKVENPQGLECSNNQKKCTWDLVCSYSSGVCKACPQCKSRCESWCEGKIGRVECGKQGKTACTREEVCGFGDGVKCSDCGICKAPSTTKNLPAPAVTGCEPWCKDKIGQKECDQKQSVCSWGKICTWSSGKCSKCSQCPTADPTCSFGVKSKLGGSMENVCCKHTCGKNCGGSDCAKQGRDSADCCGEKIKSAKKSCKANLPPCVLESKKGGQKGGNKGGNSGSNSVQTWLGLVLTILMALTAAA